MDAHGSGLWLEHAADALENFLHVERLRGKCENAGLHLFQVKQVIHEALYENKLTHHEVAVFDDLGDLLLSQR